MYYIVEIRPNGIETFLEGFEEFLGDVRDTAERAGGEAPR